MTPPSWPLVRAAVEEWLARVDRMTELVTAGGALPELVAESHNHFEQIHRSSTATERGDWS